MADLIVNRIGAARVAVDSAHWQGRRPGGGEPRKRRRAPLSLAGQVLAAIFPGRDPEEFEIAYETFASQFLGLVIRDARTGEVLRTLSLGELSIHAPGAGAILERRG
jgi:hypothetical protein